MVGVASVASIAEVVDGIGVGSVVQTGVGYGGSGNDGSSNRGGNQGCGLREDVDRGRSLLGGKTSSSGVIKSSQEGSLGSGDILDVIQVRGSNLRSLHIGVDGVESIGPQGSVLPSLGGCEGGVKGLLGSGHLGGVLKGGGSGQRQERAESLKCFAISANSVFSRVVIVSYQLVHVECCSGESSE